MKLLNRQSKAEKCVARGAEWLDQKNPKWFLSPEVDELTSVRRCDCIAQLAMNDESGYDQAFVDLYYEIPTKYRHENRGMTYFGMNANCLEEDKKIVAAWKELIADKRAKYEGHFNV